MKRLVILYTPSILLFLLACSQIILTHTKGDLNPDKGGGFGLFSTIDKLNNRSLLILGSIDGKESLINVNSNDPSVNKLKPLILNASSCPSDSHLKELTDELLNFNFSKTPDSIRVIARKCIFSADEAQAHYQTINELKVLFPKKNSLGKPDQGQEMPMIIKVKK
jgi:hypothetical protein